MPLGHHDLAGLHGDAVPFGASRSNREPLHLRPPAMARHRGEGQRVLIGEYTGPSFLLSSISWRTHRSTPEQ